MREREREGVKKGESEIGRVGEVVDAANVENVPHMVYFGISNNAKYVV